LAIHDPRWLKSRLKEGDNVALAADVVLSGSRIIRAIEEVTQSGGQIAKIIILIDSEDGNGVDKLRSFLATNMMDVPVKVIFTRSEIFDEQTGNISVT
jgi:orotate phosphoribosyltransferase